MLRFDEELLKEHGKEFLLSVDEVGRGSIYGSGFVASYLYRSNKSLKEYSGKFNDSKALSADNINKASDFLMLLSHEEAYYTALEITAVRINRDMALGKTFRYYTEKAITKCLDDNPNLTPENTLILLDGNDSTLEYAIIKYGYKVVSLPKADAKSATCAAASILAKRASNDNVSKMPTEEVALYDIANNKGYNNKAHTQAIKNNGLSENHRYFA